MNLSLSKKYKSLDPFELRDLPDFMVLTGLNGAGKSQLLEGIMNNVVRLTYNDIHVENSMEFELDPKKLFKIENLAPVDYIPVDKAFIIQNIKEQYRVYMGQVASTKGNIQNIPVHDEPSRLRRDFHAHLAFLADKPLNGLSEDDFLRYYPLHDNLIEKDVFQQNFTLLFKRYQDRFNENVISRYKNENLGFKEIAYLSEEKFIAKYGDAPWHLVNEIIATANLDYHIKSPISFHDEAAYQALLVNNISGAEINFAELSSGEKVLMSFAFALYNADYDKIFPQVNFPQVILMDEPDASLHPLMSKQLLDVIQKVFIKGKRVRVIMTTHSPSTVAFAPEYSIFVVNKHGVQIESASRDKALKTLTYGVPSFSINYENRRQVFVESPNDVSFYEFLYTKFSGKLNPEISLTFISSGDSRLDKNGIPVANCDQVNSITTIMRTGGNKFVWGIIDFDEGKTKDKNEFVKVLGNGNRYAIESYLLDPLLITILMYREKFITEQDLGLKEDETYVDLKDFQNDRLQRIADFTINKLASNFKDDGRKSICKLINEREIFIPNWYLLLQGHTLETELIKIFPRLLEIKKKSENALKMAVLIKVVDDLPGLISVDLIDLLKEIQKG